MNLYRSFGNLMEAWMTEGSLYSDSHLLGNNENSPTPSSDMETNLRSESVDSGVETASSDTSFHTTSYSVSMDNAEIDTFVPEEGDRLTQTSTSQSPVLSSPVPSSSSSSSPHLCPRRPQGAPNTVPPKVEEALQRTYTKHQRDDPEPLTVEDRLRRQPQASFLPQRHTLDLVRGQRSQSFSPRRTANGQISKICRRPLSMNYDKNRLEVDGEGERTGLSPGLDYLEQVCQMLEEIARQQMHNRALQTEMDVLRERQDTPVSQALSTCPGDSEVVEQDLASCQRLENAENAEQSTSEQQQTHRLNTHRHFRRRSASDTNLAMLFLRKTKLDYRGQPLNTDELLEKDEEEEDEKEETKKEERNKSLKNWKLKIGSLRRGVTLPRDAEGQKMQSSEKTSARHRLSQLFRRRRRTVAL